MIRGEVVTDAVGQLLGGQLAGRLGHVSQFSTPQEVEKFMQEAGFVDLQLDGTNPQLVVTVGNKPTVEGYERPANALNPEATIELEQRGAEVTPETSFILADGQLILPYQEWLEVNEHIIAKDAYIAELEGALALKNRHIAALEATVRKQERMMRPLPVRVALRLSKRS